MKVALSRAMKILCLITVMSVATGLLRAGVIEIYEFSNDALQDRYQVLIEELRCPKCQNQNLAGSDSPIAADLRREIRELLEMGKSDHEIKDFLTQRYGVFVLYDPPIEGQTLWVWVFPFVFLTIGLVTLVVILLRNQKRRQTKPDAAIADQNEEWP